MVLGIAVLHRNGAGLESVSTQLLQQTAHLPMAGDGAGVPTTTASTASTTAAASTISPRRCFPLGVVLDGACERAWLDYIETIRQSLPLDSKRPTVDRRFFVDRSEGRIIVGTLEDMVQTAIRRMQHNRVLVMTPTQLPHTTTTTATITATATTSKNKPESWSESSSSRNTNSNDNTNKNNNNDDDTVLLVYCNPYLRILEYTQPGTSLAPHTDGIKSL
jgi:hypothetical protein